VGVTRVLGEGKRRQRHPERSEVADACVPASADIVKANREMVG
jgi:hypothetical protein